MRVVREAVGDVLRDGTMVHSGVRIQQDDQGRVAVFSMAGRHAPIAVYAAGEVTYTITRKPCACKGDPPRTVLARLWDQSEKVAARHA